MNLFGLIAAVLSLYFAICIFRVLLTWFGPAGSNTFLRAIHRISQPWIGLFADIKWLKIRNLDFSPVLALIILQVITNVFWNLSLSNVLTIGLILVYFVEMISSAINFFLVFFMALGLIRLIGILIRTSSIKNFWYTLDHILQPMVYPILAKLFPRRVVPYGTGLGIFLGVLLVLVVGLHYGTQALVGLLLRIGI